jgi:uncharacterized protein (DUF2384 family)
MTIPALAADFRQISIVAGPGALRGCAAGGLSSGHPTEQRRAAIQRELLAARTRAAWETIMSDEKTSSENSAETPSETPSETSAVPDTTEQGVAQIRSAISTYLGLLDSAGGNDLSSAFANYAGRNVANAVAFAQKLVQVRDVEDLVKVQTEFIKSQMEAVAEQAAAVRQSAEKASAERLERIAALAEQVLGDRVKARRWLRRRRRALNGEMALAYLASESGAQIVEDMLRRIQQGTTT